MTQIGFKAWVGCQPAQRDGQFWKIVHHLMKECKAMRKVMSMLALALMALAAACAGGQSSEPAAGESGSAGPVITVYTSPA